MRRPCDEDSTVKVINFKNVPVGVVVTRSAHYRNERAVRCKARHQLGMIFGLRIRGAVTWPVILWEGVTEPEITHPVDVRFFRPEHIAQYKTTIEMES